MIRVSREGLREGMTARAVTDHPDTLSKILFISDS
jgi:hypothetical protein